MNNLRIRKLTPSECLKLMGFTYEDYEAMKQVGLSDSAIYHCAGDSIVVPVLMAIFNQFKDENTHKQIIYDYVNDEILNGGQLWTGLK